MGSKVTEAGANRSDDLVLNPEGAPRHLHVQTQGRQDVPENLVPRPATAPADRLLAVHTIAIANVDPTRCDLPDGERQRDVLAEADRVKDVPLCGRPRSRTAYPGCIWCRERDLHLVLRGRWN